MSNAFLTGIGFVFVIEGLTYALVPGQVKKMMASVLHLSDEQLRVAGTVALAFGVVVVWMTQKMIGS